MEILVGVVLALSVGLTGSYSGMDRDRAFYPTVLIIIASYNALFAVMGGSPQALLVESPAIAAFVVTAITGFKRSLWLVAAALAAHGIFDLVHGQLISNPGVPSWWPNFCMAFDLVLSAVLALRLSAGILQATTTMRTTS